jgi:hypothetical protein
MTLTSTTDYTILVNWQVEGRNESSLGILQIPFEIQDM